MHLPDILVLVCSFLSLLPNAVDACGDGNSCYGPISQVQHVRHIKRMQPGALNASYGPRGPLEWGQINFLHTVGFSPFTCFLFNLDCLLIYSMLTANPPFPS